MAWPAFKNSTNKMIREKSEITQQYQSRVTPPVVDWLMPDEIFVFGSNAAGIHGAGAARTALELFGAKHETLRAENSNMVMCHMDISRKVERFFFQSYMLTLRINTN